jgi:hypothetical protein
MQDPGKDVILHHKSEPLFLTSRDQCRSISGNGKDRNVLEKRKQR